MAQYTGHAVPPLQAARVRRGLTRAEMAREVGVSETRLGQYLDGSLPMPDEVAARVREVLGEEVLELEAIGKQLGGGK